MALTIDFFGLKALVIGSIPILYWLFEHIRDGNADLGNIELLVLAYAVVGVSVFIWKWIAAQGVLAEERRLQGQVNALSPEEQAELKRLIDHGRIKAGQSVFDRIAGKTDFIKRDPEGMWRIEDDQKQFLRRWAKKA